MPRSRSLKPTERSVAEATFALQVRALKCSSPQREYRFDTDRRWRFDFAWPEQMLAVEIEGGIWSGGRHTRGAGFQQDCEKYNAAVIAGWRVLRFTTEQVMQGAAILALKKAVAAYNIRP